MTSRQCAEPLDWKVPPGPREPAIGYASRLAALNGPELRAFAPSVGVPARRIHIGDDAAVRGLAALGGLDPSATEALRRFTPRRFGPADSELCNEKLAYRSLLTGYYRFCPHCITQDLDDSPMDVPFRARPWLRVEWMIDQIRSCRKHAVRLIETRRATGQPAISDFSKVVALDVLPSLARLNAEAVTTEANAFEDWILRRLDGVREPENWLDRMPLYAGVDACEALGFESLDKGGPGFSELGPLGMAAASLAGHRIAMGAEAGIKAFLDGLVRRGHATGFCGSEKIYGHVLTLLERSLEDPAYEHFRDIVRRHAIENIPFAAGDRVLGQVLEERLLHTAASAAALSNTCHQTLRVTLARAGMAAAIGEPGHRRLTFRVGEFEALLDEYAAALTLPEIQVSTGIVKVQLLDLIAHGVIPTLFGTREIRRARHRVAASDIDAFMSRLFEGAVQIEKPTRRQVPLGRACLIATTNIVELVNLVLAGGLSWKGSLRGGRLYTDLLVDADEVMGVLQKDKPPRRNITKGEIREEMIGMRLPVVNAMIKAGELTVAKEFCTKSRRHLYLVTRESFETFRRRYVTVTEISSLRGLFPLRAIEILAAAGCRPVFTSDTHSHAVYARTEAIDAAMAAFPVVDPAGKPQCIGAGEEAT